jgi:hypothetical protein
MSKRKLLLTVDAPIRLSLEEPALTEVAQALNRYYTGDALLVVGKYYSGTPLQDSHHAVRRTQLQTIKVDVYTDGSFEIAKQG